MRKKLLSALLACLLIVGLAVPASAAEFSDLSPTHWAARDILELAGKGLFQGYEDGTVKPEGTVTNREALAMCARMAVQDGAVRDQLKADRTQELAALLPAPTPATEWFLREAATCLELGIVTEEELRDLDLGAETTKAEFALYIVRAMGQADRVRLTAGTPLPFVDDAEIPENCRAAVCLLYNYGIITGNSDDPEQNAFQPRKNMSRAECATFLCRALRYMDQRGILVELPQFTNYAWAAGTIRDVAVDGAGRRVLTLRDAFGEDLTVTLPESIIIYLYNQPNNAFDYSALKVGAYARVCYASDGATPEAIRVTPKELLRTVTGPCDSLTPKEIAVNGAHYAIDRFTQVSAGDKTGDAAIIDYDAAYTDAQLTCDGAGRVLELALTGGTRRVTGILSGVSTTTAGTLTRTAVSVTSYAGRRSLYDLDGNAVVTVDGTPAQLKESLVGRHITLRVAEEDLASIQSADVNVTDKYIQGILKAVDTKATPNRVEIIASGTTAKTPYEVTPDCAVSYDGGGAGLANLPANSFVTAKVEGGSVTWLAAYPAYETVEGTLTGIVYGDPTVLNVTQASGTVSTFSIPLSRVTGVTVTLDGKEAQINELTTGQHVSVTLLYDDVNQVDALSREANVTGTLNSFTQKADGTAELELLLPDGTTARYTATAATTVRREGAAISLKDLQVGSRISLAAEGTRALSIEVTGAAQTVGQLYGTVYYVVSTTDRTLYLLVEGRQAPQLVSFPYNLTIWDATTNSTVTGMSRIKAGDVLRIYGSYDSKGTFAATSVVREGKAG